MVRLVFRPYTQVWRSICTSESLQTSTRVSSGFVLPKHSSPSFGYQRVRYNSAISLIYEIGGLLLRPTVTHKAWPHRDRNLTSFTFIAPLEPIQDWVTRAHVRLLGPCFKTGQMDTDLLAIDCWTGTQKDCHQHRGHCELDFPCKTHKDQNTAHSRQQNFAHPFLQTPHKWRNWAHQYAKCCLTAPIGTYNTGMQAQGSHPATLHRPSHTDALAL